MRDGEIPPDYFDAGWPRYFLPERLGRWLVRHLADRWGVPEGEVVDHGYRRRPCRTCGYVNRFRCDLHRCDRCFLRWCVEELRRVERQRWEEIERRRRLEEARTLIAGMPSGRRRLVELSGMTEDPVAAYAEAYGEW